MTRAFNRSAYIRNLKVEQPTLHLSCKPRFVGSFFTFVFDRQPDVQWEFMGVGPNDICWERKKGEAA